MKKIGKGLLGHPAYKHLRLKYDDIVSPSSPEFWRHTSETKIFEIITIIFLKATIRLWPQNEIYIDL